MSKIFRTGRYRSSHFRGACQWCRNPIERMDSRRRYCSDSCRQKAYRARRAAG